MIVAFHGKLKSGKDTAGERLAQMVDLPSTRLSFAAPLKESAAALLDIDVQDWETYKNDPDVKIMLSVGYVEQEIVDDWDDDANPLVVSVEVPNLIREFTAREFLQRYGTESHREIFGSDFWVEQAVAQYRLRPDELCYVTDARFVNEAAAVRGLGGIVIRVLGADDNTGSHASEVGLPDDLITFEIDNSIRDDDFENLDSQLASIASMLGLPLKQEAFA